MSLDNAQDRLDTSVLKSSKVSATNFRKTKSFLSFMPVDKDT